MKQRFSASEKNGERRSLLALLDILGEPLEAFEEAFAGRSATERRNISTIGADVVYVLYSPWMDIPGSFTHSVQTQLFSNFGR